MASLNVTPYKVVSEEQQLHFQNYHLQLRVLTPQTAAADIKPVLVFLHDSLGSIELWRDFPERLVQLTGCKAIIYDRRGYGRSSPFESTQRDADYLELEADILEVVLEKLQVPRAILFGHSDGGSIVLISAAKYPKRIAGIISEGAHVFVEDITLAGVLAAKNAFETTNLPERLQKYHGSKTEAVFCAWTDIWLSERFRDWNIEGMLPGVLCPILVIQGEADEYGTLAQVDAVMRQIQGPKEKLVIPEVGHTPHREAQEVVLSESAAFILKLKQ